MNLQNAGTATVNGHAAYVIALSFTPANFAMAGVQTASFSQRIFYIDQQSYLRRSIRANHLAICLKAGGPHKPLLLMPR